MHRLNYHNGLSDLLNFSQGSVSAWFFLRGKAGINLQAIAFPRHDQNLINWSGFEEFASEAVYFPLAATASAFLYPAISGIPAFPGMSITNQFDGLARGKSGGQLVTRLHTNYRCKSHLIENNLKWYRHWHGASCPVCRLVELLPLQRNTSYFQCQLLTCVSHTQRACAGFIGFTCKMFVFGAHKRYKPNCFSSIGNSGSISFHLPAKSATELRAASWKLKAAHGKVLEDFEIFKCFT